MIASVSLLSFQQGDHTMRKTVLMALPLAFLMSTGAALAGPAMDMAKTRIEAIAKGDVATITKDYGKDKLGPLTLGHYRRGYSTDIT